MAKEALNPAGFTTMILEDGKGNRQYAKVAKGKGLGDAVLHRTDGPALEYANGYKAHYKDGLLNGTVEFGGKVCSTWKNGVKV